MNQVAAILVGGTENTGSPDRGSSALVPSFGPVSSAEPGRRALRLITESKADQAARADLVYKGSPFGLALATGRQQADKENSPYGGNLTSTPRDRQRGRESGERQRGRDGCAQMVRFTNKYGGTVTP